MAQTHIPLLEAIAHSPRDGLLVSLLLDLGDLYEAMQGTLLLLLPVTGYKLGKISGSDQRMPGARRQP